MAAKLWFIHCGWLNETSADGVTVNHPVPTYLIESDGKRFLVDTGNPKALIGAPDAQPWFYSQADIKPEDDPIARLAEMGLQPTDIDAIIATHLDFDHSGRYDAFGPLGMDVYIQRAQMREALSGVYRYHQGLWNIPGLRWHYIDGDAWITPDIKVMRTDGHVTGHQSLLVQTDAGPVVLAADACDSRNMFENRVFPEYCDDVDVANASIDRLAALATELDAPLIFGHDQEQWESLPHSPEPYSKR